MAFCHALKMSFWSYKGRNSKRRTYLLLLGMVHVVRRMVFVLFRQAPLNSPWLSFSLRLCPIYHYLVSPSCELVLTADWRFDCFRQCLWETYFSNVWFHWDLFAQVSSEASLIPAGHYFAFSSFLLGSPFEVESSVSLVCVAALPLSFELLTVWEFSCFQ